MVVMRYGYWQRRFNRNPPSSVNRSRSMGAVFTVVGVAAPEFFGTEVGRAPDLWTPLAAQSQVQPWLGNPFDAQTQSLWLIGRMRNGVKISLAEAYINVQFQHWLQNLAGSFPSAERVGRHAEGPCQADQRCARDFTSATRSSRVRCKSLWFSLGWCC